MFFAKYYKYSANCLILFDASLYTSQILHAHASFGMA
jgi:hypothetical protein